MAKILKKTGAIVFGSSALFLFINACWARLRLHSSTMCSKPWGDYLAIFLLGGLFFFMLGGFFEWVGFAKCGKKPEDQVDEAYLRKWHTVQILGGALFLVSITALTLCLAYFWNGSPVTFQKELFFLVMLGGIFLGSSIFILSKAIK